MIRAQEISSLLAPCEEKGEDIFLEKGHDAERVIVCEVGPLAEHVFWCVCMPTLPRPLGIGVM